MKTDLFFSPLKLWVPPFSIFLFLVSLRILHDFTTVSSFPFSRPSNFSVPNPTAAFGTLNRPQRVLVQHQLLSSDHAKLDCQGQVVDQTNTHFCPTLQFRPIGHLIQRCPQLLCRCPQDRSLTGKVTRRHLSLVRAPILILKDPKPNL